MRSAKIARSAEQEQGFPCLFIGISAARLRPLSWWRCSWCSRQSRSACGHVLGLHCEREFPWLWTKLVSFGFLAARPIILTSRGSRAGFGTSPIAMGWSAACSARERLRSGLRCLRLMETGPASISAKAGTDTDGIGKRFRRRRGSGRWTAAGAACPPGRLGSAALGTRDRRTLALSYSSKRV